MWTASLSRDGMHMDTVSFSCASQAIFGTDPGWSARSMAFVKSRHQSAWNETSIHKYGFSGGGDKTKDNLLCSEYELDLLDEYKLKFPWIMSLMHFRELEAQRRKLGAQV